MRDYCITPRWKQQQWNKNKNSKYIDSLVDINERGKPERIFTVTMKCIKINKQKTRNRKKRQLWWSLFGYCFFFHFFAFEYIRRTSLVVVIKVYRLIVPVHSKMAKNSHRFLLECEEHTFFWSISIHSNDSLIHSLTTEQWLDLSEIATMQINNMTFSILICVKKKTSQRGTHSWIQSTKKMLKVYDIYFPLAAAKKMSNSSSNMY